MQHQFHLEIGRTHELTNGCLVRLVYLPRSAESEAVFQLSVQCPPGQTLAGVRYGEGVQCYHLGQWPLAELTELSLEFITGGRRGPEAAIGLLNARLRQLQALPDPGAQQKFQIQAITEMLAA